MRVALFAEEPAPGLSGLAGLTSPDDDVTAVVDAVVLGAKSDGKTQLITHLIRTLDAQAPPGLSEEERLQNDKILALVLNAKRPQPEANPDKKVRHYVFRVKAKKLLHGLGTRGALRFLLRGAALAGALVSVGAVAGAVALLRGAADTWAVVAGLVAGALGAAWGAFLRRRELLRLGDIEIVFWDVAGEDVYSDRGAGAYHSFLTELARARRQRPGRYAFAPILVCNPMVVGRLAHDSPYARLRMILPSFAALDRPAPEILVVVNRWVLVRSVLGDGEERADETLAIWPVARDAPAAAGAPAEPLPLVTRSVVERHCLDAEPERVGGTRFRTIHYEAGLDAQAHVSCYPGWAALPDELKLRFADPGPADRLVEYRYAEGPGALAGDASAAFHAWLAAAIFSLPPAPQKIVELEPKPAMLAEPVAAPAESRGFRSGS
ncbi:MAG TPA: hypothetical protein VKE22_10015 [Haliangiales bacterium]|nr:hypothetical protein [Haliangiales bacterium]